MMECGKYDLDKKNALAACPVVLVTGDGRELRIIDWLPKICIDRDVTVTLTARIEFLGDSKTD